LYFSIDYFLEILRMAAECGEGLSDPHERDSAECDVAFSVVIRKTKKY
jgi:hypothetical protein